LQIESSARRQEIMAQVRSACSPSSNGKSHP
jgi:hypothetical protein